MMRCRGTLGRSSALLVLALLAGCRSDREAAQDSAAGAVDGSGADGPPRTFGGDRPVSVSVPASYDPSRDWPLVFVLHGYSANGFLQKRFLYYDRLVDDPGVLLVAPDGTVDREGHRFWNATPACCNFFGSKVDDVAYIRRLIREISAAYSVDSKRIYLIGHSNGGFFAYRLACELSDRVAAIVSIAGATYLDPADCDPKHPVAVLHVHGDQDTSVRYAGGRIDGALGKGDEGYPGARETVKTWARYDHCSTSTRRGSNLDLDSRSSGAETIVERFSGCPAGAQVTLWTIEGGTHVPLFAAAFSKLSWRFLAANPKP